MKGLPFETTTHADFYRVPAPAIRFVYSSHALVLPAYRTQQSDRIDPLTHPGPLALYRDSDLRRQ